MKIELIQGTLEVTENPGLDTTDPRFSDIATLVQEGNYLDAASGAEAILEEKIYDIRMIGYFLYGHFMEQGIPALTDIYLGLADLLSENLEAFGPVRNRAKHIQTILNWLTRQILKALQYEEGKKSDLYDEWVSAVSSDQVQEALDAGEKLRRILVVTLEDAATPVLEGVGKINDWLKTFQHLVYHEPKPEPEQLEEKYPEEGKEWAEADEGRSDREPREEEGPQAYIPKFHKEEETPNVEGSYHLKELLRKLEAFDYLIAKQKYPSAAIVADDINAIIAAFDPRIYFPKLFTPFVRQSATHINELVAYEEYKSSAAWQSLQELYKVDLDSFVDFDPEVIGLTAYGAAGGHGNADQYGRAPEDEEQYAEESRDQATDDDEW